MCCVQLMKGLLILISSVALPLNFLLRSQDLARQLIRFQHGMLKIGTLLLHLKSSILCHINHSLLVFLLEKVRSSLHLVLRVIIDVHLVTDSDHLHLLLLHHDVSVEFEVDLVGEHVQARVRKDLPGHFSRVYQVIDVVSLHVVKAVLEVEEGEDVEKERDGVAPPLAQVV